MAKVQNNVMVRGLCGSFGNQMVLKTNKAGRTIVGKKPVFQADRVFTPAQRAQQARFRAARAYARQAKDLEIYRAKAAGTPQTPSNIAMTDWFHPPEILEVDLSGWTGQPGQIIRIRATDDVQVRQVVVEILDESGEIRERGEGIRGKEDWWIYSTTAPAAEHSTVVAAAEDLPGHITRMTKAPEPVPANISTLKAISR